MIGWLCASAQADDSPQVPSPDVGLQLSVGGYLQDLTEGQFEEAKSNHRRLLEVQSPGLQPTLFESSKALFNTTPLPAIQPLEAVIAPTAVVQDQPRLWLPERAVFTPAALEWEHGRNMLARVEKLGVPVEILKANRLSGLRGADVRETYNRSKRTLAVVTSPPSYLKLQPIPPSADWQFHIAEGCPAHCQYCYLAGSLAGPPVVRAFANLPEILENLAQYETKKSTTFEVSCYTDPLALEHLTGSLSACLRYFGTREKATLRWVSKFDNVESLLDVPHHGRVRARVSVNIPAVSRQFEGGTAPVSARLTALRKLAQPREAGGGSYSVGLVIAPIMPLEGWQESYGNLLDKIAAALHGMDDVTFELITHRFTPGSKEVLLGWYPKTRLDLEERGREVKRNKFGGTKYVYPRAQMKEMRVWFEREIAARFGSSGRVLYWT